MICPDCLNETGQSIEMTEVFRSYKDGDKGDSTAPPDVDLDYVTFKCKNCGWELTIYEK